MSKPAGATALAPEANEPSVSCLEPQGQSGAGSPHATSSPQSTFVCHLEPFAWHLLLYAEKKEAGLATVPGCTTAARLGRPFRCTQSIPDRGIQCLLRSLGARHGVTGISRGQEVGWKEGFPGNQPPTLEFSCTALLETGTQMHTPAEVPQLQQGLGSRQRPACFS